MCDGKRNSRVHVLSTAEGGIMRLKILQKSFGVMMGKFVGPNATFGSLGMIS